MVDSPYNDALPLVVFNLLLMTETHHYANETPGQPFGNTFMSSPTVNP